MSPALDAALAGPNPTVFGAIEIELPNHTIRILTGSGIISFTAADSNGQDEVKIFTGSDATYGSLYSIGDINDGVGGQAPSLTLTLAPASTEAAVDLANSGDQGSPVTIWLGAVEPSNGLVIGEPLMIFLGELDVPILKTDDHSQLLELQISSAFEAFFLTNNGVALSHYFHMYLWPGETGLSQVTGILRHFYFGSAPATGVSK